MTTDIDSGIAPLVSALNSIQGITTRYSCQGHVQRLSSPYIWFECPVSLASLIELHLRRLWQQGHIYARWRLTGSFNKAGTPGFRLSALEYDQHYCQYFLWRWWHFGIHRPRTEHDIRTLAQNLPLARTSHPQPAHP